MVVERPSRKLLIVDDEPLVRQTLTYVLQDEYDVLAVASGEEAIEASTRESYPVVILDLCMEGLSGIETLQKLKEIRENQNIIILTAYESTDSAIAALNLGAFNYITKPFERAHLKRIISRGFDVYEQQVERAEEMRQRLRGVHNRFFSLLCQEFNTPLNVILGFSEMLTDGRKNLEFPTWVQHIKDAGNHLHELLMEIVDYIAASDLAEVGVNRPFVTRELLAPLIRNFAERGTTFHFDDRGGLYVALEGPSDAVWLIVKRLARIAAQRSKEIHISTYLEKQDGLNLKLVISGTGIQKDILADKQIDRLFEPYEFTSQNNSSCNVSLGLELATCRRIADYAHATVEGLFDTRNELELIVRVPVRLH